MSKDHPSILFVGPHRPGRNPSQRFRMEQYFPYLIAKGFTCEYSWFINEQDDHVFYSPGNKTGKFLLFLKAIRIRLGDVLKAKRYDIIFVQREAFMTGSVFFEKQFARSGAKLIYDFDDAIWLEDTSAGNKGLAWLKRPAKTAELIAMSDQVIAGNNYLADYALKFNHKVAVIPTVVDTNVFKPSTVIKDAHQPVCIGWTGSSSTVKHFELLIPVFYELRKKYGDRIRIMLIGDSPSKIKEPWVEQVPWKAATEVTDLQQLDIGVMPLPDDAWSRGKCGFKAIQYMSLAIPCVASPIGVNTQIIQQGVNGFLSTSNADWMEAISTLIESKDLRSMIGRNARESVVNNYSVNSQLEVLSTKINSVFS